MWLEKLFYRAAILLAALLSIGFGLLTIGVVIAQVTGWLKYAVWPPFTIADALQEFGIPRPYTPKLLGLQKLIDNILEWPGIVAYIACGILCVVGAVRFADPLAEILRKEEVARKKREQSEREAAERQERHEAADRTTANFDFAEQIEDMLGKKHR
jgi:hypothetical protein